MSKMIFVNLPVTDLAASVRFYEAIGCEKNEQFSDENAASMVWSPNITFMLLTRDYFTTFATRHIADPQTSIGVLLALSQESRAAVDAIVKAAASAGGKADTRAPQDYGFMYQRTFEDPDGHVFEPVHMDLSQMPETED